MYVNVCPKQVASSLFARLDIGLNRSTWDKCMDKSACKIGVIVGIVVVAIIVLWILSTIIRCLCCGISCLEALCCCCCRKPRRPQYVERQTAYNNPNMYAPVQPMRQAEPVYQPVNTVNSGNHDYYNRYERSSSDGYKVHHF